MTDFFFKSIHILRYWQANYTMNLTPRSLPKESWLYGMTDMKAFSRALIPEASVDTVNDLFKHLVSVTMHMIN